MSKRGIGWKYFPEIPTGAGADLLIYIEGTDDEKPRFMCWIEPAGWDGNRIVVSGSSAITTVDFKPRLLAWKYQPFPPRYLDDAPTFNHLIRVRE